MKRILSILFAIVLVSSMFSAWPVLADTEEKVSMPGEYSGYSEQLYDYWVLSSQYVEGHDGTLIAVDIYRPSEDGINPVSEPWPGILISTRYHRQRYNPANFDSLLKHGYVVVVADARGTGASYGAMYDRNNPEELLDGKAVIEWLADQSWCDGRIAMMGGSFLGQTQLMIASTHPTELLAVTPASYFIDRYKIEYPDGVFKPLGWYPLYTRMLDLHILPAKPVDEDTPPDYPLLEGARLAHMGNIWPDETIFTPDMFRDTHIDTFPSSIDEPMIDTSAISYASEIEASGVRMYHMDGWYTGQPLASLGGFNLWGDKVIMGPWNHGEACGAGDGILLVEYLRWFDYILKGIDNGILDEPPIYYYTVNAPEGEEWRFAPDWPLPNQELTNYYFGAGPVGTVNSVNDGGLSTSAPTSSGDHDDYTVDYDVDIFDGHYDFGGRDWEGDMTPGTDEKGLTYTSPPLDSDVEVTGHPVVNLWVTSTEADGYFCAFLEEVDSEGYSRYVSDGKIRASHRAVHSQEPWDDMGVPYHRSFEEDYAPIPEGELVELTFDLYPTSYVFRAGNRIRVTITGAHSQEIYGIPESLNFDPPPDISIYRDTDHPSSIILPIIPPKPTVFEGTAKVKISDIDYRGPAELYTFETAVYLHFDGQWIEWETIKNWQEGSVEHYKCEGETGKLSVLIQTNEQASFEALATGQGVHFKGNAK